MTNPLTEAEKAKFAEASSLLKSLGIRKADLAREFNRHETYFSIASGKRKLCQMYKFHNIINKSINEKTNQMD
jgi:hypothetical protein